MATTNGLSSVDSLMRFMGLRKVIPDAVDNARETVGTGDDSATVFWLDKLGVIEDSYTLYHGDGGAATATSTLTETTHYTTDLNVSKITLTAAGVTALGTNSLFAEYAHNLAEIPNAEALTALNAAENRVLRATDVIFADFDAADPAYLKVSNEPIKGHYNPYGKVFDLDHGPVVKIQTTLAEAYTTGGTTALLTDSSGLPSTGTLYIGGNKVAYSALASDVITIPSATPTIAADATVRGEVIEVSFEPESTLPSYTVLDPDTEYEIDYDQGRFKILSNAYWGEVAAEDRVYPSNYLIRTTYMHAWHKLGQDPEIPDEIEWCVNAIAARKLMGSVVAKAHQLGLNDFNPRLIDVDKEAIQEVLDEYATLNVGTSPYNKQSLS